MKILSSYVNTFIIVFICVSISLSIISYAYADNLNTKKNREILGELITSIGTVNNTFHIPDINTQKGAEELVDNSIALSCVHNCDSDRIRTFNEPLQKMGINFLLLPEVMIKDTICKYYGYSINEDNNNYNQNDYLTNTYNDRQVCSSGYYAISGDPGNDPGDINIDNISLLENGSLLATGKYFMPGDDNGINIKAIFNKSNCGGKDHWVPINISIPSVTNQSNN